MPRFRFKPWMALAAVLLLLVAAFLGTFYLSGDGREATAAEDLAGSAAKPVVEGAGGFAASVRDFFSRLFALRDVDREYESLKTRVQMLELENQFMQDLQAENERLSGMLGFTEQYPRFECLPAKVIGREPGNWFMNVTLDRGEKDGVEMNMSVVNEDGLVGRVVQVGTRWCKVMTVIDRQSAVSVVLERTRDNGVARGSGDPQGAAPTCVINYLPPDSEVSPGDTVVTNDHGGVFLKGIVVGTITEVSRDENQERYAVMTPAADFAHLENVLIVTSEREVPTEEEIAAEIAEQEKRAEEQAQGTEPPEEQATEPPEKQAEQGTPTPQDTRPAQEGEP